MTKTVRVESMATNLTSGSSRTKTVRPETMAMNERNECRANVKIGSSRYSWVTRREDCRGQLIWKICLSCSMEMNRIARCRNGNHYCPSMVRRQAKGTRDSDPNCSWSFAVWIDCHASNITADELVH